MTKLKSITLSFILASTFVACGSSKAPTIEKDDTVTQTPIIENATIETPVVETPVVETPVVETPVANNHTVFATGKTDSFIPNDDGSTKRGTSRSYTKANGIITDSLTKLEWQDNVSSTRANWTSAVDYCKNLTINGVTNWRLPTMDELNTLVDLGQSPHISTTFSTAQGGKYWTSTEYPLTPTQSAYYIDFSTGFSADYGSRAVFEKNNNYAVRCVRGEALQQGNFSRNDAKQIVTDSVHQLMWEDTAHTAETSSVDSAISYCENLSLGGFSDWHLPHVNELFTITDRTHYNDAISRVFEHSVSIGEENAGSYYRKANYWTSTYHGPRSDDSSIHYYRTFHERDGVSHRCRSYMGMHVRCVRAVK